MIFLFRQRSRTVFHVESHTDTTDVLTHINSAENHKFEHICSSDQLIPTNGDQEQRLWSDLGVEVKLPRSSCDAAWFKQHFSWYPVIGKAASVKQLIQFSERHKLSELILLSEFDPFGPKTFIKSGRVVRLNDFIPFMCAGSQQEVSQLYWASSLSVKTWKPAEVFSASAPSEELS